MIAAIEEARDAKDSLGGTVTCICRGLPAGLGEPVFDKLEAKLAHAMLSIPATKLTFRGINNVGIAAQSHNCYV